MKYFLIIFAIFLLSGCSKPGYSTRINISENAGATKNDIHLITDILQSKSYETLNIKEYGSRGIESYRIKLDDKKFNDLERKYIGLAVEYWCSEATANAQKAMCQMEVRIGNPWEGKKPILKNEIDKITDIILTSLLKRFNEPEINVRRAYSAPI